MFTRESSSAHSAFEKWATGFSGCDGGNPRGEIWICGIEFGGGIDDLKHRIKEQTDNPPTGYPNYEINTQFPFNRNLLKLFCGMWGWPTQDYEKFNQQFKPFTKESKFFKMNLFPISFPKDENELWNEKLKSQTGITSKENYKTWCRKRRFPKITKWINQYQPKLVIGLGKTYVRDFKLAFENSHPPGTYKAVKEYPDEKKELRLFTINQGKTLLAVIPFIVGTPQGLNSDHSLQKFGETLAEKINSFK